MLLALNFLRSIWIEQDKPLGGRYKIVEKLGAGGFGQTFKAVDLHLPGHPLCVVKQLKPQVSDERLAIAQRLFDTEAETLYNLGNHPQIPRLLAHFSDSEEFYLAQELIDGHSLSDELDAGKPWDAENVVALLGDILGILTFVHNNRVIHRDLKPSNLIRRHQDNRMVMIDFGSVKQASTQFIESDTGMTRTVSIGTQGYMPNEQLAGTPSFSSDVYAVGMLGIQALTGKHPRLLMANPRTGEVDWHLYVSHVPSKLLAIIDKMVKYDFRSRYPTATDALADLHTLPETLKRRIPIAIPFHHTVDQAVSKADLAFLPSSLASTQAEQVQEMSLKSHDQVSASQVSSIHAQPKAFDHRLQPMMMPKTAHPAENQVFPIRSHQRSQVRPFFATLQQHLSACSSFDVLQTAWRSFPRAALLSTTAAISVVGVGVITWHMTSSSPKAESSTLALDAVENTSPGMTENVSVLQRLQEAQTFRDEKQYEQALVAYDDVIEQGVESSAIHAERCYSLNQLERYGEALVACDRAIALDPNNANAFWSKGFALEQQQQFTDALVIYDTALTISPDFAEAWNNKGTTLIGLDRSHEAVAAFNRALELKPDFPEALSNRGVALWNLQDFEAALKSVEQALIRQPDNQDAKKLQTEMKTRLGRN